MVKRNESLKSLKGEKDENALKSDTSDLSDSSDLSDRSDFDGEHLGEVRSLKVSGKSSSTGKVGDFRLSETPSKCAARHLVI